MICRELNDDDGFQSCYEAQARILHGYGPLKEVLDLIEAREAIRLKIENRAALGQCY